jgi:predicted RNA-binding protein with PUA-like domain
VGIVEIASDGYPDPTAFDPESRYFDPRSDPDKPRWYQVDVRLKKRFTQIVSLAELRTHTADLSDLALLRRGNRLSVMPVSVGAWRTILALADRAR